MSAVPYAPFPVVVARSSYSGDATVEIERDPDLGADDPTVVLAVQVWSGCRFVGSYDGGAVFEIAPEKLEPLAAALSSAIEAARAAALIP